MVQTNTAVSRYISVAFQCEEVLQDFPVLSVLFVLTGTVCTPAAFVVSNRSPQEQVLVAGYCNDVAVVNAESASLSEDRRICRLDGT